VDEHFSPAAHQILYCAIDEMRAKRAYKAFDTTMLFLGMVDQPSDAIARQILEKFSIVIRNATLAEESNSNADGPIQHLSTAPSFIRESFFFNMQKVQYNFTLVSEMVVRILESAQKSNRGVPFITIQSHHILRACLQEPSSLPYFCIEMLARRKRLSISALIAECVRRQYDEDSPL